MKSIAAIPLLVFFLGACKSPGERFDPANAAEVQYPEGTAAVWSAVVAALGELDLKVESDHHDALGGRLVALRATGEKVVIEARTLNERSTQVSIGLASIDRNMAGVIHSHISRQIAGEATAGEFFGGNSLENTYEAGLAACVLAAERGFEALSLEITQRSVHDARAEIISRKPKATPVLIRMETNGRAPTANGDGAGHANGNGDSSPKRSHTHVTFVAGTTRSPENESLVKRLKGEFERLLR
jgi:hypothetical protein